MTDVARLKQIACYMVSDPDTCSDGAEVARAVYEIERLRRIVSQLPLETVYRLAYVSGRSLGDRREKTDKQDADRGG